ncbi:MAG: efflux transporter outer membrane subunit [Pseudomonadota bacterium]
MTVPMAIPVVVALTLLLSACVNLPERGEPKVAVPETWEGAPEGAIATTGSSATELAWWESFNDPALTQLIELAQQRNLDLQVADARIREVRALQRAANASLFPSLSATGGFTRQRSISGSIDNIGAEPATAGGVANLANNGAVIRNLGQVGLEVSWEADVFGRLRSQARAAQADVGVVQADRDAARLTLLAEVARNYVEYRLYQVQTGLAQQTATAQERTARISRLRFEQGLASRLDVERSIAELSVTRSQLPAARELAESARYRLSLLLASTPDELSELLQTGLPVQENPPQQGSIQQRTVTLPSSDPLTLLLSPNDILALRPDVRAARLRLISSTALRDASEALQYPTLTITGLLGLQNRDLDELLSAGSRVWSIGGGVAAPLLDFGRIRANIDAADARQEQAFLQYERTIRDALRDTQTAIVLYTQGVLRQQELARARDASSKATALARLQYQEGTLSLLDVLIAERASYDAQLAWSQAAANVATRTVALYQAMGVVPSKQTAS